MFAYFIFFHYLCITKRKREIITPLSLSSFDCLDMLILVVTDFLCETTKVTNTFEEKKIALAEMTMQKLATDYMENMIVADQHYPLELAKTFFKKKNNSIHCKADCGDNIKWEIIKI